MTDTNDDADTPQPPRCHALLVIEDDHDVREVLQYALEAEGYSVVTAANGREAIAKLATTRPCLILLDLMMPVMNGFEFLQARQQDEQIAAIPVVVVSAYDRLAASLGDVAAFVPKPVNLAKMLRAIREHCG